MSDSHKIIGRDLYRLYSWHRSRQNAADALESYFAAGEISAGEGPRVAPMKRGFWGVYFRCNG